MSALEDLYREALSAYALRQKACRDRMFGPEAVVLDDLSEAPLAAGTAAYVAEVRATAHAECSLKDRRARGRGPARGSA